MFFLGFPGGFVVKNLLASAEDLRDLDSIPGLGRSPGGRYGNPLCILAWRIPQDRGAWRTTVHEVAKSQIRLKQLSTAQHSTAHIKRININIQVTVWIHAARITKQWLQISQEK